MKKPKANSIYYDMYENEDSKVVGNKRIKHNKKKMNKDNRQANKKFVKDLIILDFEGEDLFE